MYSVPFVSATYVWRMCDILDSTAYRNERVAYLAYQCARYVLLLWSMCDELGVIGIFDGVPRKY